jgi:hypothetical protein
MAAAVTTAGAALARPPAQSVPAIPEPDALALFVLGASVLGIAVRRRKQ